MPSRQERNILWQRLDAPGWEHLRLSFDKKGTVADGLVISVENGRVFRLRYQVRCDPEWRCRGAELELDEPETKLVLKKKAGGDWLRNGKPVRGSADCIDIDVAATPFTNTLPIRRLALSSGQAAEISALYIQVPELEIKVVQQKYHCLSELREYTYQGLDGREYRVAVDAEGLVTDYEDVFRRIWPLR
ncbi:MAG: putative glycolipid-binding domain-containing protein [Acidobacteriales bacterium]|nr:putative glycolipid-binding domain-containing protein [Terriglobales bacterium]